MAREVGCVYGGGVLLIWIGDPQAAQSLHNPSLHHSFPKVPGPARPSLRDCNCTPHPHPAIPKCSRLSFCPWCVTETNVASLLLLGPPAPPSHTAGNASSALKGKNPHQSHVCAQLTEECRSEGGAGQDGPPKIKWLSFSRSHVKQH